MSETPGSTPPVGDEPPPSGTGQERPRVGVNTDGLYDYRALRRSSTDRKVAGVAAGLGRHFNIDPLILRVAFVVLAFFGGAGLALYGALWLLVPRDDEAEAMVNTSDRVRNALLVGAVLIAGLMVVGDSWGRWHFPWFVVIPALIVFAIFATLESERRRRASTPPGPTATPTYGATPPSPPPGPTTPYADPYDPAVAAASAAPLTPPTGSPTASPAGAATTELPLQHDPVPPRTAKRGPFLFGPTFALIAIGLGILGIVDAVSDLDIPDSAYPALGLAITGFMLMLGAFFGRPGGLVALGVLLAIAVPLVSIVDPMFSGDRDLHIAPTVAQDIADEYTVPAGRIELDLTSIADPTALTRRTIDLRANVGEIVVIVPNDLPVVVDATVDWVGATTILGRDQGGFDVTAHVSEGSGRSQLRLNLSMKIGHLEVRRG